MRCSSRIRSNSCKQAGAAVAMALTCALAAWQLLTRTLGSAHGRLHAAVAIHSGLHKPASLLARQNDTWTQLSTKGVTEHHAGPSSATAPRSEDLEAWAGSNAAAPESAVQLHDLLPPEALCRAFHFSRNGSHLLTLGAALRATEHGDSLQMLGATQSTEMGSGQPVDSTTQVLQEAFPNPRTAPEIISRPHSESSLIAQL